MHAQSQKLSGTQVRLGIVASSEDLKPYKTSALNKLAQTIKVPGFRPGKVPLNLVEKNVDPQSLQTEFLDLALSDLYARAAASEHIRPVSRPEVSVKKFVPYSSLEFEVVADVIGDIKLADYKRIKLVKKKASVSAKDVDGVIESLRTRMAQKIETLEPAKNGDQVWIDFSGVDEKGKPVQGADGKDYPLVLGSNTFIPGFEDNIRGLKPGQDKTFTLTFPADYGVKALAGRKVTFTASVKKVEELNKPAIDDDFAAKIGPFKTVKELRSDIKKQLTLEQQRELDKQYHNELVGKIADKSELEIPPKMVEHQAEHNIEDLKRNLTYRGQTYEDFLKGEGMSDDQYKETTLIPQAQRQIKISLVLDEIAKKEDLSVTPEELDTRLKLLKSQYSDEAMQAELNKEENQRDIASRLLTEKVLAKLEQYATASQ